MTTLEAAKATIRTTVTFILIAEIIVSIFFYWNTHCKTPFSAFQATQLAAFANVYLIGAIVGYMLGFKAGFWRRESK